MRISDWSSDVCSSDLKGAGEIIDRLTATGKLKPEAAFAARLAVAALGRPDTATGETVLSAPISLRQGMLYLGPIPLVPKIGRASCRERVCQYVSISVVAVSLKKKPTEPQTSYLQNKDKQN